MADNFSVGHHAHFDEFMGTPSLIFDPNGFFIEERRDTSHRWQQRRDGDMQYRAMPPRTIDKDGDNI